MDNDPNIGCAITEAPGSWTWSLQRARADVKAGRVVSSEAVLRRLDEAISRLEAGRVSQNEGPGR